MLAGELGMQTKYIPMPSIRSIADAMAKLAHRFEVSSQNLNIRTPEPKLNPEAKPFSSKWGVQKSILQPVKTEPSPAAVAFKERCKTAGLRITSSKPIEPKSAESKSTEPAPTDPGAPAFQERCKQVGLRLTPFKPAEFKPIESMPTSPGALAFKERCKKLGLRVSLLAPPEN